MTVDRAPISLKHGIRPSPEHLAAAIDVVDASGLVDLIEPLLARATGRPPSLRGTRGMLVVFQANAMRRHHMSHLTEVARLIETLTADERSELGIIGWSGDARTRYGRLVAWFNRLAKVVAAEHVVTVEGDDRHLDVDLFMNRLVEASIPPDAPLGTAIAIDETAIDAWAVIQIDPDSIEAPDPRSSDRPMHLRSKKTPGRKAKVQRHGPDGRPQYTCDPDARGGYRTSTGKRKGGPFVGYGLHIATQVKGTIRTNGVDKIVFEDPVPNLIRGCALRPAGSHSGEAVIPMMRRIRERNPEVSEAIVDAGYSLKRDNFLRPARMLGYKLIFELQLSQRGEVPVSCEGRLIDGNLYSEHLPDDLVGTPDAYGDRQPLPRPALKGKADTDAEATAKFDERARWAYRLHGGPDQDGYRRLRCPFCARKLRAAQFTNTARLGPSVPFRHVTTSDDRCCRGESLLTGVEGMFWQHPPFGTTAWIQSYGRRATVESVNAALKGQFTNIEHGHVQTLGRVKLGMFLAFTLAGCNYSRLESHQAKLEEALRRAEQERRSRARRRRAGIDQAAGRHAKEVTDGRK